ncbi:phosphoribosylglycinamide formyltransferase [Litorimonas sp. WD9-15]|uniref:phosphoribosylglycinamide formyltransferase n=1 Tax=Litorimonas sp. WD9-15 TaxID=3418716 RepID=UPI003CFCA048
MLALIEAAKAPNYPAEIQLVISNRPKAGGLKLAKDHGVKALSIDHNAFATRAAFEVELDRTLQENEIEFIVCAGFMRVLGAAFVCKWTGRLINIHPSLLPKYKGLNTHQRALDAGDTHHGCTVHWVSEGVDEGDIIAQSDLIIKSNETPDDLSKRVQQLEHSLYPRALRQALGFD